MEPIDLAQADGLFLDARKRYSPGGIEQPQPSSSQRPRRAVRKARQTKNIFYSGFSRDYDKGVLDILADVLTVFLS